jgi:hypothetical protein
MTFINWFKKLFQKKKHLHDVVQQSTPQQSVPQRNVTATQQAYLDPNRGRPNFRSSHEIARQIVKEMHVQNVRERNIERQRSVLGYGLHGKFRPRPAHEKKTFDLRKKPERD